MAAIERVTKQTVGMLRAMSTLPEDQRHGFALAHHAGIRPGTAYKVLDRLLEADWLTFRWDPSPFEGRPPRKLFSFTEEGGKQASALLRSLPTTTASTTAAEESGRTHTGATARRHLLPGAGA